MRTLLDSTRYRLSAASAEISTGKKNLAVSLGPFSYPWVPPAYVVTLRLASIARMQFALASATNTVLPLATTSPMALVNGSFPAGGVPNPPLLLPAIVVTWPAASIIRTQWLPVSIT
ncbi:hypothetical protein D3C87_1622360 [compost metagenome]